jgi:NAD(P)-dependent dehydrogenase (short-subunit alcohol dehydrogenase family)
MDLFSLKEKVAVITGGTSPIGSATARVFADYGADVALLDVKEPAETEALVADMKGRGVRCAYYKCDVSETLSVRQTAKRVIADFGRVNVLMNNAAKCHIALVEDMTDEWFDETIAVSLRGTFLCSREFGRYMIAAGNGGSIFSTASIAGLIGLPRGTAHHAAAKAGIMGFIRTLAVEWAKYGIRVNCIAPGQIMTPGMAELFKNEQYKKDILVNIPLGRVGRTEEIAAMALYLASDASGFTTGQTMVVDGGATIH